MAEQDRYGGWFGGKAPKAPSASDISAKLPEGSGAEQDRYASHFSGKLPSGSEVSASLPATSGAEQDRYAAHFSGKLPSVGEISDRLPRTSGAEQDRYAAHFSGKLPTASEISDKLPRTSGAEQDRYAAHFSGKLPTASEVSDKLPKTSGAEQDRYGNWFGGKSAALDGVSERLPRGSGAEQDRYGSHFGSRPTNPVNATAVGLLQSSILPSFGFHASLSAVAYGVSRFTDRAEGKDLVWPLGMTANAWWSALGIRVVHDGLTIPQAWSTMTYPQKLLLAGVSAWGIRLLYRVASRSTRRQGDDPRYAAAKKDPSFWNKALFNMFIPEAVIQTVISLPFTLPFRAVAESAIASPAVGNAPLLQDLAVFLFSTGYALEVLADTQLETYQKRNSDLNREGVWSIVRHPNYLGDAIIHASFPVLLLSAGLLHPITLLGPVANYFFLRFVGGEKENEKSQEQRYENDPLKAEQFKEYRRNKNSFWPAVTEVQNKWTWVVLAAGAGGVLLERGIRAALH